VIGLNGFRRREAKLFPSRGVKLPCLLRFNMNSKLERKMATQNPNRLRTNCPGGSLTLGGDTTVNRLGFGAMRLCGPGVWGEPLDRPGAKRVLMRAIELGNLTALRQLDILQSGWQGTECISIN
jgi:hypothetical protein